MVLKKLDNYNLVIIRQAGETGQLYGSVNTNDVKATLNENGFIVEKNQIKLDKPIKELGVHAVSVKLHPEVQATISVIVSRTETEAEILLKGDELKIDSENISTDEIIDLEEVFEDGAIPVNINDEIENDDLSPKDEQNLPIDEINSTAINSSNEEEDSSQKE